MQIGTRISDPTALIDDLTSPAGRDALLADLVTFGDPNSIGKDVYGLYQFDRSVPIATNIQLVDQPIYAMIGNTAALGTSYPFAIIEHNTAFAGVADISFAGSVVLMGCFGGPSIAPGLGAPPSLRMCIPEAMSVSLLFASKAFMARHCRMEWF